jgi:hypothetical protein
VSFAVALEEHTVATFGASAQKAYCTATANSLGVTPPQVIFPSSPFSFISYISLSSLFALQGL